MAYPINYTKSLNNNKIMYKYFYNRANFLNDQREKDNNNNNRFNSFTQGQLTECNLLVNVESN